MLATAFTRQSPPQAISATHDAKPSIMLEGHTQERSGLAAAGLLAAASCTNTGQLQIEIPGLLSQGLGLQTKVMQRVVRS
jgi:hypothetical protein